MCVCVYACVCATLSISSPDSLRRFSSVKSPMTSPLSPQHMSITKNPLSSKALIWWSVNMASALYLTSLLCCTSWGNQKRMELNEFCVISCQPLRPQTSSSPGIAIILVNLHTIQGTQGDVFLLYYILIIISYCLLGLLCFYIILHYCTFTIALLYYYYYC